MSAYFELRMMQKTTCSHTFGPATALAVDDLPRVKSPLAVNYLPTESGQGPINLATDSHAMAQTMMTGLRRLFVQLGRNRCFDMWHLAQKAWFRWKDTTADGAIEEGIQAGWQRLVAEVLSSAHFTFGTTVGPSFSIGLVEEKGWRWEWAGGCKGTRVGGRAQVWQLHGTGRLQLWQTMAEKCDR